MFSSLSSAEETQDLRIQMAQRLEQWEREGDRRCVFLRCYWHMTGTVLSSIAAGAFSDNVWVASFLHRFATYYLTAVEAYEGGPGYLPPVWKQSLDMARVRATTVVEDLVLGMNAHINRDLSWVVYDLLWEEWASLSPMQRQMRRADFNLINSLIAQTSAEVQQDVVERYSHMLQIACDICRPAVDAADWEMDRLIAGWRDGAWLSGVEMLEAPSSHERIKILRRLEKAAVHRMLLIVSDIELRERFLVYSSEILDSLPVAAAVRLCHSHRPDHRKVSIGDTTSPGGGH